MSSFVMYSFCQSKGALYCKSEYRMVVTQHEHARPANRCSGMSSHDNKKAGEQGACNSQRPTEIYGELQRHQVATHTQILTQGRTPGRTTESSGRLPIRISVIRLQKSSLLLRACNELSFFLLKMMLCVVNQSFEWLR